MQISENLLAGAASIEVLSWGRDRECGLAGQPQRWPPWPSIGIATGRTRRSRPAFWPARWPSIPCGT